MLLIGRILLVIFVTGTFTCAFGQELLDGEFSDITLGRELVEPTKFPTLREIRNAVRENAIRPVLMLKMWGSADNHHLPVWSPDGARLALQQTKQGQSSSRLLVYDSLGQAEPRALSEEANVYEYMFRWGINKPSSFVFARIESSNNATRLMYSSDGNAQQACTAQAGPFFHPSLFERTDGIHWLAYERAGEIIHQAWTDGESIERPVARGTTPRWSSDGKLLLLAEETKRDTNDLATYRIVARNLSGDFRHIISEKPAMVVRTPTWSPNLAMAAFYERDPGQNMPWRIQVGSISGDKGATTIADDVVVNPDFNSEGPSWEPSSRRVWCFSHSHREQEYYPIVSANASSSEIQLVHYPRLVRTPQDLALNPATRIPEVAFVAHRGQTRDLFVLFFNHY